MEKLQTLRELYEGNFITESDYNSLRLQIIDEITNSKYATNQSNFTNEQVRPLNDYIVPEDDVFKTPNIGRHNTPSQIHASNIANKSKAPEDVKRGTFIPGREVLDNFFNELGSLSTPLAPFGLKVPEVVEPIVPLPSDPNQRPGPIKKKLKVNHKSNERDLRAAVIEDDEQIGSYDPTIRAPLNHKNSGYGQDQDVSLGQLQQQYQQLQQHILQQQQLLNSLYGVQSTMDIQQQQQQLQQLQQQQQQLLQQQVQLQPQMQTQILYQPVGYNIAYPAYDNYYLADDSYDPEQHNLTIKSNIQHNPPSFIESLRPEERKPYTYEFFHAAARNNVKVLNELLEMGIDINQRDPDSGNSALHIACLKGQKHSIYFLVDRGIDIDGQNKHGFTALHYLVTHRYNNIAVWLVKQGADISIEDDKGFAAYDLALPWLQKEMKQAVYGRKRTAKTQQEINKVFGALAEDEYVAQLAPSISDKQYGNKYESPLYTQPPNVHYQPRPLLQTTGKAHTQFQLQVPPSTTPIPPSIGMIEPLPSTTKLIPMVDTNVRPVLEQEILKIYLKNGSYKSLLLNSEMRALDVCAMMAEKIGMERYDTEFDLMDIQKGLSRRLDPYSNVFKVKSTWPLILGKSGNETDQHCRFVVVPKHGTSENVLQMYRRACQ